MTVGSPSVGLDRDLTGVVIPGRGLGADRMARPDLLDRMKELAGFVLVPGTLNVRLSERFDRTATSRYVAAAEISADWEAETGQAGYFLVPVLVANRYRGDAFQADEPGYPPDQVELLCEAHLRATLGLRDGDPIAFSVLT
jgi:CTP-dependent riboflavin kinase